MSWSWVLVPVGQGDLRVFQPGFWSKRFGNRSLKGGGDS